MSRSRELQAERGGDRLIDEDVIKAIADAKLHCGHCGGTVHTLLTCSWAPGLGTRHLTEEGQLAPGLVVSAGGKVHGNQLSASYSTEEWLSFEAVSETTYGALTHLQAVGRVATTLGETAIRP